MNLADLVCAVPHLAQACITAQQDAAGTPGSGIKALRLLCKPVQSAMFQYIQGCTFHLGLEVSSDHILALVRFVQACQLSRLGMVILPLPCNPPTAEQASILLKSVQLGMLYMNLSCPVPGDFGHRPSTAEDAQHFAQQLDTVLSGLGSAALSNITWLELDVQDIRSNNAHFTKWDVLEAHPTTLANVLLPVALACPAVRLLRVAGSVGRAVIARLGEVCEQLTSLEVVCGDVPLASLGQLHLLLPRLVSLKLLPPARVLPVDPSHGRLAERRERVSQAYARTLIEYCIDCVSLTNLDAAWVEEENISFPPMLLRACMARYMYQGFSTPRSSWVVWANLQTLVVHVHRDGLDLHHMGRLVAQAPQLTVFHAVGACVVTSEYAWQHDLGDDARSLICLGERGQRGLKITAANEGGTARDLTLALTASYEYPAFAEGADLIPRMETSSLESILQDISPFTITTFPGICISHAIMGHSFHLIPRIFPDITSLTFVNCEIHGAELAAMGSLSSLHSLSFRGCKFLLPSEVRDVCLQLHALRSLACMGCAEMDRSAAVTIQEALGQAVEVRHNDISQHMYIVHLFPLE